MGSVPLYNIDYRITYQVGFYGSLGLSLSLLLLSAVGIRHAVGQRAETKSERKQTTESQFPRFSRKAIVGACWAAYFLVALGVMVLAFVPVQRGREESRRARTGENLKQLGLELQNVEQGNRGVFVEDAAAQDGGADPSDEQAAQFFLVFLVVFGLPAALAPFGTTILGCVAISDIRHSQGRLTGMGLAVADAVVFPLLILNGAIFSVLLFWHYSGMEMNFAMSLYLALGETALMGGWASSDIIKRVWNATSHPVGGPPTNSGTSFDDVES